MRAVSKAWALWAVAAAMAWPPGVAAQQAPEGGGTLLVARGRDYLLHALAYSGDALQGRYRWPTSAGCLLLHTRPSTGKMSCLLWTGTHLVTMKPMSFVQTRIVGLTHDSERLYVVVWTSPLVPNYAPQAAQPLSGGSYSLAVFWLEDGSKLRDLGFIPRPEHPPSGQLVASALPRTGLPETLDAGPLKLTDGRVEVFGIALEFEGRQLVGHSAVAGRGAERSREQR